MIPAGRRTEAKEVNPRKSFARPAMESRDVLIDYLRAIASFLVVLFHTDSFYRYFDGKSRLSFAGGWVGVDIFFIISGVVITQSAIRRKASSERNGRRLSAPIAFLNDRAFRIYPPFIAACLLAWGLDVLSPWMTRAATDPYMAGLGDSLRFFWKPDAILGVAWTLRYEAVFYLLVMVYLFPGVRFIGLLFVLLVGAFMEPDRYQFHYAVYFLAGVLIGFARIRWASGRVDGAPSAAENPAIPWVKGAVAVGLFVFALYNLSQRHTRAGALLLIGSYLTSDFLLKDVFNGDVSGRLVRPAHRAMLYLGRISYSLYLVHTPIILFMMKRLSTSKYSLLEMMLLIVPVVLLSASVFHHVVEDYSVAVGRALAAWVGRLTGSSRDRFAQGG
jgi:exopolysaccharide production protein ExoZ